MCTSSSLTIGVGIGISQGDFKRCTISWVSQNRSFFMVQSTKMTSGTMKVSRKLPPPEQDGRTIVPQTKKRRTLEDFNTFCSLILAYEGKQEDVRQRNRSPNSLESVSSSTDSAYSETASSPASSSGDERLLDDVDEEYSSDDESWNKITCYCQKPFAGRPMIECSECLTWIHLSCAKIRKSNVPDVFICQKCRDAKHTMRRSNRVRTQPKTKAINLKS